MKKLIALLLTFVMLFALTACGGDDKADKRDDNEDEILGKYLCTSILMSGEEIGTDGEWIKLDSDGEGKLYSGIELDIEWELDGKELTVETKVLVDTYTGTLKGDIIELDMGGSIFTFVKEGSDAVPATKPTEPTDAPITDGDDRIAFDGLELLFLGSQLAKDAYDNDAVILSYVFTNNSEESASFEWSFYYNAYQNGECLDTCTVMIDEVNFTYYGEDNFTNIEPGESMEVYLTFTLLDTTSPVLVEFESLMGDVKDSHTVDLADAEAPVVTEPQPTEPEPELSSTDYWAGDWYGWWVFDEVGGTFADMNGSWWDCCATITFDESGNGTLVFWDEDYGADDCIAEVQLSFVNDYLMSVSGYFDNADMTEGEWVLTPDPLGYENLICITGTYYDPSDSTNYYEYSIYLRPWGTYWDDIAADSPDDLPYYYESWYLPLIEAGESMPTAINAG